MMQPVDWAWQVGRGEGARGPMRVCEKRVVQKAWQLGLPFSLQKGPSSPSLPASHNLLLHSHTHNTHSRTHTKPLATHQRQTIRAGIQKGFSFFFPSPVPSETQPVPRKGPVMAAIRNAAGPTLFKRFFGLVEVSQTARAQGVSLSIPAPLFCDVARRRRRRRLTLVVPTENPA
jgi:hypothetical protein